MRLACRWQNPSATAAQNTPDDPDHMAVLRDKAVTAALMYSDASDAVDGESRTGFAARVQDLAEEAGEFGISQDIDDAVELAQTIRLVSGTTNCS